MKIGVVNQLSHDEIYFCGAKQKPKYQLITVDD